MNPLSRIARFVGFAFTVCACSSTTTPAPTAMSDASVIEEGITEIGSLLGSAQDYVSAAGLAGLTVKTCPMADTLCASPMAITTTDASGNFTLAYQITRGLFVGFFEFSGGSIAPTRYFVSLTRTPETLAFPLFSQAGITALSTTAHTTFDSGHGAVTMIVRDLNPPVAGAIVTDAPNAGTVFYLQSGAPSTAAMSTDTTGRAGFLGLATGTYAFIATDLIGDLNYGTVTVNVVGGYVSAFGIPHI